MTNLYISLYPEANTDRKAELAKCLLRNHKCPDIDQVFILAERSGEIDFIPDVSEFPVNKFIVLPVSKRPTFRTFFDCINTVSGDDEINIIANADIYFDEIKKVPLVSQVFALTRYEVEPGGIRFLNRPDSQDSYFFRGKVKIPNYCQFFLGQPGCDNRIARELSVVGYEVSNPSLTIKSYHLHRGQKSYDDTTYRVKPPYLKLTPIQI